MTIEYNVRGILRALFRQKFKILLILALFSYAGFHYLENTAAVYEARGSLLVKFGRDARPAIEMPGSGRPAELSYSDRAEIMESNIGILQSRDLLRGAVSEIGADRIYPALAAADREQALQQSVNRLAGGDFKAQAVAGSNIIALSVRNGDPEIAARFAGLLIDRFAARQAGIYNSSQTGFLDAQTAEMKTRLDRSREEFLAFKKETGIAALEEELAQMIREKSELTALAFESVAAAQTTLAALEAKQAEMRATYKSDSPFMVRLQDSIALARKQLRERQDDLNAKGGDSSLSAKIAAIDGRIAWLEQQRGRYNELEQRVAMNEENYLYYRQRGEEARVNNILNAENITRIAVIDRPSVPLAPVHPRKELVLLAFVMAGLLIGLGTALIFELLDDRASAPEHLSTGTGLPVLASFGKVKGA